MKPFTVISIFFLPLFLVNISKSQYSDDFIFEQNESKIFVKNKNFYEELKTGTVSNNFPAKISSSGLIEYTPIGIYSVYDFQNHGSSQKIWQDENNPANVHCVYTYTDDPTFEIRHTAYLFSSDYGLTWTVQSNLPETGRGIHPSVAGFDNGRAIIAMNSTSNGTTSKIKIYIDSMPGAGTFTEYTPENPVDITWPRVIGKGNSTVIFTGTLNASSECFTNTLTNLQPPGTFSGYQSYTCHIGGRYYLAKSPAGLIGHAYIGDFNDEQTRYGAFYRFSTDDGLTWSTPQQIWTYNKNTDTIGCFKNISMVYKGEIPVVTFETCRRVFPFEYFPREPAQIRVWSPDINGGVPVVAADTSIIPFYPNLGDPEEDFATLASPVIGKTSTGNMLILAFIAPSGNYASADSSSYYSSWITFSTDGGATWINHEKITPQMPLRDWRFISLSPTNNVVGNTLTVQMICQSDSAAGIFLYSAPIGVSQPVGIRYTTNLNSGIPISPRLISPSHNSNTGTITPLMNWSDVSNAATYGLQISTDEQFTNIVFNLQNISLSEITIPGNVLNINSIYYWKVNASNTNGSSVWTPTRKFNTNVTGIHPISNEVPVNFKLLNNYPNPFNPVTKIEFDIPSGFNIQISNVKLVVYDALGKEVQNLVNESLLPGSYSVSFNGSNLNSGIYFYTLSVSGGSDVIRETKKMMLLK